MVATHKLDVATNFIHEPSIFDNIKVPPVTPSNDTLEEDELTEYGLIVFIINSLPGHCAGLGSVIVVAELEKLSTIIQLYGPISDAIVLVIVNGSCLEKHGKFQSPFSIT